MSFTLVGGAFDLFHGGHLHLLEYASGLEEGLVVCVLSDQAIRAYKDPDRPIVEERERVRLVASIRYVTFAYLSDTGPTSAETLSILRPASVVFGGGEANAQNVKRWTERISVHSPGTKIRLLPRYRDESISTSHLIRKIRG